MNLIIESKHYIDEGLNEQKASIKVCLDVFLYKLARSRYKENVTIKGGAVMQNISNYLRRFTKDIDFDFIHYSLSEDAIRKFISDLNRKDDDVIIEIVGKINDSKQQDYHGKKIKVVLKDQFGNKINGSFDIGVQSDTSVIQNNLVFYVGKNKQEVTLLANSIEQIFTEKLKSLLKHNIRSTRYKDIYDFYYLINEQPINKKLLKMYINRYIIKDSSIKYSDIYSISEAIRILSNREDFKSNIDESNDRWIDESIDNIIFSICDFIDTRV